MATQFVTVLSVIGVLGTAGTAMAANTDVLATIDSTPALGQATESILPVGNGAAAQTATPAPTAETTTAPIGGASTTPDVPGAANNAPASASRESKSYQAPAAAPAQSGAQAPAQPAAQSPAASSVNGTTGGSGARVASATPTIPQSSTTKKVVREHEDRDDD